MGFDKIFANIGDITVIEYSINAFLECNSVNEVIVVINEKSVQKIKDVISKIKDVISEAVEKRQGNMNLK